MPAFLMTFFFLFCSLLSAESTPKSWDQKIPAVQKLLKSLQPKPHDAELNFQTMVTDGLVVMVGSTVVFEHYANGYTKQSPHPVWSVSKSVVNALVGIAVREKSVSVNDSVCKYLKTVTDRHCEITIQNLLHFTSGLEWREAYENEPPSKSSVVNMLYGEGKTDMASFALGHPILKAPDTIWEYSSGSANILMAILKKAIGSKRYSTFPWDELFEKLEMKSATWERDSSDVFVGSSYLHLTPRDLALFGRLFKNDGVNDGKRILPDGWVDWSLKPNPVQAKDPSQVNGYISGAGWWLNTSLHGKEKPFSFLPSDTFAALGHWGQYLFVIPSLNLTIARTGNDREDLKQDALKKLIQPILEAYHAVEGH